jgi:hypothetical protein
MDEMTEFQKDALEALRQPLEDGKDKKIFPPTNLNKLCKMGR